MNNEKKAKEIIEGVKHPAIDHTLYDLGIVKSYNIEENSAKIVMALPALNIPIIDTLIQSLKQPLSELNYETDIEKVVMTQEDVQKFFAMEQSAWKGL
ncbi:MAG: metal-sulfur cluster biosynthetic enzyme [Candidatus Marinimicrobia bacterium]|nr:metal-sulfur cluster biosynthetic enzyme [Candidatus Neomarinimicrobiota bacterium]